MSKNTIMRTSRRYPPTAGGKQKSLFSCIKSNRLTGSSMTDAELSIRTTTRPSAMAAAALSGRSV